MGQGHKDFPVRLVFATFDCKNLQLFHTKKVKKYLWVKSDFYNLQLFNNKKWKNTSG